MIRPTLRTVTLLLLIILPLGAQPWPEFGPAYDTAAFEPVTPAALSARETVFLGHGSNSQPGQPTAPPQFLGSGFTVADLNGDGKNDFIAASATAHTTGKARVGAVWIWFGNGTTGVRDTAGLQGTAPDVRIFGADAEDGLTSRGTNESLSSVLNVGDCTGDGIADLMLHAQEAAGPDNARFRGGEAYLFFGKSVWPPVIDLAAQTPEARADVWFVGESNNLLGSTAGGKMADLTGDGIAEIILPAIGRTQSSRPNPGEVLIFPGRPAASWPAVIDLAVPASIGTRILGPLDNVGVNPLIAQNGGLATADLNQDGIRDLIITSRGVDGTGTTRNDCGGAYLLFGRAVWPSTIDLHPTTNAVHADVRIIGLDASDALGQTGMILTGDCDGDGLSDLILSATEADGPSNARSGAGEVYLIWGRTTWPAVLDLSVAGAIGSTIYGASAGNLLGDRLTRGSDNRSVAAIGDVNNDGLADLVLGSPPADGPGETRQNAGEIYLVLGRPRAAWPAVMDALPTSAAAHPDCTVYGQGPVTGSGTISDELGQWNSLALGDVTGDGMDDILVAAPERYLPIFYQPPSKTSHGMAFLIKGRTGAWPATIDTALPAGGPGAPDTSFKGVPYSRLALGGSLGLADVDGDGGLDVVLGNPDYDFFPNGKLGVADFPGDRMNAGGLWVYAGVTPNTAYAQAVAQLPQLTATTQFTVLQNGSVTFSYERDILLAQLVVYTALGSPDLINWTPMPLPPQIVNLGNGSERVTHTFTAPAPSPLYGKVSVSPQP